MKSLSRRVSWLVAALAIVLAAALAVSVFGAVGMFSRAKAEDGGSTTVTIKLNDGKRVRDLGEAEPDIKEDADGEIQYTANGDKLVLDYDTVCAMFENYAPVKPDAEDRFLTDDNDDKGSLIFVENALLFGLFVDIDGDGEPLSKGEKVYYSGDVIDLSTLGADKTLTCYYTDNGYVYSQAAWGMDKNAYVNFTKAWKSDNAPVDKGSKRQYTAKEMQPLFYKVGSICDKAFSIGSWCDVVEKVEIPSTVEVIGYQAFGKAYGLTEITGMDNVYGVDAEAFNMTHVEKYVFSNLNYFSHYAFVMDGSMTKIVIESWQHGTSDPRFFADNGNPWLGIKGASITSPNAYIYVPAGKTEEWYKSNERNDFRLFDTTSGEVEVGNIPMREFYKVSFDLNGASGKIANQHVDAGAVSVKDDNEAELNITSYDDNNGEQLTSTNEAEKNLGLLYAEMPEDPEREGYIFTGWKVKGSDDDYWTAEDFGENGVKSLALTADVVLEAQWAEAVSVTFKTNNGSADIVKEVAKDTAIVKPNDPVAPAGKAFDKWYKDEALTTEFDFATELATDGLIIYAKYNLIDYTVTYELNGGTAGANAPATFTVESQDIALVAPTKDGYTFEGWYDNEQFSGTAVTKIDAGSTGNKKFYAKWKQNETTNPGGTTDGDNSGDDNKGDTDTTTQKKGCKSAATSATSAVGAGIVLLGAGIAVSVSKKRKA